MSVKLTVHQKHIIPLGISSLYITVLLYRIGSIDVHNVAILIGLRCFDEGLVLIKSEVFALRIAQKSELEGRITEFLISEHSIFDEYLYIVPL